MTIFLTTHYMEEADQICDRVAILDQGRVLVEGTPAELKQNVLATGSEPATLEDVFLQLTGRGLRD